MGRADPSGSVAARPSRWGWVVSVLLVLALAAPAHADPRALARSAGVLAIAPGGDHVLVAQARGANLQVASIPLAGGAARSVFSFDAPKGLVPVSASLSASPQRAALIVEMGPGPGRRPEAVQTFSGPLSGGWVTLQPFTRTSSPGAVRPERQQADSDRLFTTESVEEETRVVVRDPDPREVAFAEGEDEYLARFAGDLVATTVYGEPERNRLVVRDWRTGVVTTSAEVPQSFGFIALRSDGRAAVVTDDGALYEVPPGGPARPLDTRSASTRVAYAGDALVHDPDGQLRVRDMSGRSRAFGVPTRSLEGFATEGTQVVWIANGCLLADDVGAPAAAAPGPGPCVRAELQLERDDDEPNPYLTHRLPVALRCVAAPGACRGRLRLEIGLRRRTKPISGHVPFSIPAGQARALRVPLTCRGYRLMLRQLRRGSGAVTLDAQTEDGQRFPTDLRFQVSSGPADPSRRCGEPRPPDPTGLPNSIDVGPLGGRAVPGTPCRLEGKPSYGNPGERTVRVSLTCTVPDDIERHGSVEVERVQSGRDLPEDTLSCWVEIDRDGERTGLHSCELWHGRITLDVRARCVRRCNATKRARAKAAAPATMTALAKWLATMPERPCRLCTK